MKICFLTNNLDIKNGEGRFSFDLVSNLKSAEQEVRVLTNLDLLKNPWINFLKIRKYFKESNIIHVVDIWPNGFYARLISLGLKKPIVITALGTYSVAPLFSWRKFLMKWVCRGAQFVAISEYTKEKILEIMPGVNIKVICPGLDLDFWNGVEARPQEFPEVGSQYNGLQYKPYILSVGAFKFRKGYHNSIQAFAIIAKKIENLNYVIVGQGEESGYAKELKKIIKENGLGNRVFFVSSGIDPVREKSLQATEVAPKSAAFSNGIDDNALLGFYRNAELFVLTPVEENHRFEGFGIVYLEAAASSLPIVASKNSGATSATKEGYNSILVPQNDPKKTADAIVNILSDENMKTNLGKNSLEWVKEFSWEKIIKKYIEIYNAKHH